MLRIFPLLLQAIELDRIYSYLVADGKHNAQHHLSKLSRGKGPAGG